MTAAYADMIVNEIAELGWSYGGVGYAGATGPLWKTDGHKDGRPAPYERFRARLVLATISERASRIS